MRISGLARSLGELFARDRSSAVWTTPDFRAFADSMPQHLWAMRPDGYVEYFNERALEYHGLTLDGMRGTRWRPLVHPDELPTLMLRLGRSLGTGSPLEVEIRLRAGSRGDWRWFLNRGMPLRDERGVITRWVGTATDIHDLKLEAEQLARALEAEQRTRHGVERELRLAETFTGMLAHDLRGPLATIAAGAGLLQARAPVGEQEIAGRISTSARRMARMIEQLLDFTRIRVGLGIPVRCASTELAAICAQVIREVELAHGRSAIELTVIGNTGGSWDADRLCQVVCNLIVNAVRHGEGGAIEVTIDGRADDEVVLAIHNRGAIPVQLLPHLFDPFRLGKAKREGLGLGLFIVKQIVEAHGGSLSVCSSPQAGTSFHVRLPRQSM